MSKVAELKSQAELPLWLEPLAEEIAAKLRADLQPNTKALEEVRDQLRDLVEMQLNFLETVKSRSSPEQKSGP